MDAKKIDELLKLMQRRGVAEFTFEHEGTVLAVKFAGASAPVTYAPVAAPVAAPAPAAAAPAAPAARAGGVVIKAPIVGTFYRAAEPGAKALASVGDVVRKGQVLCIIEAMKLMNEIDSDYDGEITSVYVENGLAVQYGERLFAIRPTT